MSGQRTVGLCENSYKVVGRQSAEFHAYQVNERLENIGARRLHTVLERLLDVVSFEAADRSGHQVTVNAGYVDEHLDELVQDEDLSRYIL